MFQLEKQKRPRVYKQDGQRCFLDPIRQKFICVTPEEEVRQAVIDYLLHTLRVPKDMIFVEEILSHWGIRSSRRADIVIGQYHPESDEIEALAVIECKAPDVYLSEEERAQVIYYADKLNSLYVALTNGMESDVAYYCGKGKNKYQKLQQLPHYDDMINGRCRTATPEKKEKRISFPYLKRRFQRYVNEEVFGEDTSGNLAKVCVNLYECLLDTSHKMKRGKYHNFTLLEDYGVRDLSFGNSSGARFSGKYRSFIVRYHRRIEFVSIGFSCYASSNGSHTALIVATEKGAKKHHSLQFVMDDNVFEKDDKFHFLHHGRIAVGNIGTGKISELRKFICREYPDLLDDDKIYLGTLKNTRLWYMNYREITSFVERLIGYALIRDEYRKYRKDYVKKSRKNARK